MKNFSLLTDFESKALALAEKYSGKLVAAFETERNENGGGVEVHLLSFNSRNLLSQYQDDPDLKQLSDLRNQAIAATTIVVSDAPRFYKSV